MEECPICGQLIEATVRHSEEPFIDGRYYDSICFTCASIPRTWEYGQGDEIVWYGTKSPDRLATVDEMIADGWNRYEAEQSLKAIKKLLKNPRLIITSELDFNVLEHLFLNNEKLYELPY